MADTLEQEVTQEQLTTDERYQTFGIADKTEFTETEIFNMQQQYPEFEDFYKIYTSYESKLAEISKYTSKKNAQLNKKTILEEAIVELNDRKIALLENDSKLNIAKDNLVDASESQQEALEYVYENAIADVSHEGAVIDSKIAYKDSLVSMYTENIGFFNRKLTLLIGDKNELLNILNEQLTLWELPLIKEEE